MGIKIVPYQAAHEEAVGKFNERLRNAGVAFQFFDRCSSNWLPADKTAAVYRIYRLALDDDGLVRGGYAVRCQDFLIKGEKLRVGNYQLPLSEGICERRFRPLGTRMLRSALREFPYMYSLGMGGIVQPLPKLLEASGFELTLVPFFFRVVNGGRFLKEMKVLRHSKIRRCGALFAAYSGLGSLGIHSVQRLRTRNVADSRYTCSVVDSLEGWLDEVWESSVSDETCGAIRSSEVMKRVFPHDQGSNIKLKISYSGEPVGYVVIRCTPMSDDHYFGNLRLGSIVDGWGAEAHIGQIVRLATNELEQRGADLIISNQSARRWTEGLKSFGYHSFRSNFGLAISPKLSAAMSADGDASKGDCHFNRSDGDGPIHI